MGLPIRAYFGLALFPYLEVCVVLPLPALNFDISELRLRKSTPYFMAAFSTLWLATLFPPLSLLLPGLLFLGFRAAVWSAMSHAAFENYGRRASRERLIEMIPAGLRDDCPKAQNLQNYMSVAPYFWVAYAALVVVMTVQILF